MIAFPITRGGLDAYGKLLAHGGCIERFSYEHRAKFSPSLVERARH